MKEKEHDLLSLVTGLNRNAAGSGDEVAQEQKRALDYYFTRPRGDEKPGRSQVVDHSLSAMVEANLAQMMESFTSDNIVEFDPDGPEDEDQCQLESDTCTYFVMDRNQGYWTFQEGIKDALLLRNGIVKVWVENKPRTITREYEGVDAAGYAGIVSKGVEVVDWNPEAGTLKVRETKPNRKLCVGGVPVENFRYTKNWTSIDLQDIPYCAELHEDTRSDLIQRFPDKRKAIMELPAFRQTQDSNATARNPHGSQDVANTDDKSLDVIQWFESYTLTDYDGDGIAERRRISFVENGILLENKEVDLVCFAAGSALINPHRFLGVSLYDKLKQVQDLNTGLKRALHDNANVSNKSRTAYLEGKVDDDDLSNGLVDGNIRVRETDTVQSAIMAFSNPDISAGILANIQQQNRERSELGGAALDMSNANVQLSDAAGSQGIDRAYSVMEQMAALMTRNLAESMIRNTYLLVHATLRTYFDEPVRIKRFGKWEEANPSKWPERDRITVKLGMSPGERSRRVQSLGFILNTQLGLADKGYNNILVNLPGFYRTLIDWSRASEVPNAEQYFLDPATPESQQALQSAQQQMQQDKQAQQRVTDLVLGLEQLKIALDSKYNPEQERQLKRDIEELKAQVAEMQVIGKATVDLELANREGKADGKTDKQAEAGAGSKGAS